MLSKRSIIGILILLVIAGGLAFAFLYENCDRSPDSDRVRRAGELVKVRVTPAHKFSFDTMETGVYQHLDRCYTYDVVPDELVGGLLFQGIHRPAKGTVVEFELFAPARVFFFFHYTVDGGYTEILESLPEWKRCPTAPQYDIQNGEHGLRMTMYVMDAEAGLYRLPPTTKSRACYNMVFIPRVPR